MIRLRSFRLKPRWPAFVPLPALAAIAGLERLHAPAAAAAAHGGGAARRRWPATRWTGDQPSYLRLPNMAPDTTPVRVGIILPFSSSTAGDPRAGGQSMLKAAELALFDGGNRDILLMTADEGTSPDTAAAAAQQLLGQGAEIIVGPAVRAVGVGGRAHRARSRRAGAGLFHRTQRGGQWRLSAVASCRRAKSSAWSAMRPAQGHHNFAAHGAADALWRCDRRTLSTTR